MRKSLLETNSYLKNPAQRKLLMRHSMVSSFAVEGNCLKEDPSYSVKEDTPTFTVRKPHYHRT